MKLRPYQVDAIKEIKAHYAAGTKKVLLHLMGGAGKTSVFCTILKGAYDKNKKAIIVVKSRKLVDQASQRLEREQVPHGVIMSGHWRDRPNSSIFVCSIDTLYSRRDKLNLPEVDLIVIDECHNASTPSYKWLVQQYPNAYYLPVSATPFVKTGLRHIADEVVYPISASELIGQGFLCDATYYAPSAPDLTGIEIDKKTGDYNTSQLGELVGKANLFGDMVASYKKLANNLSGLVFCVDVKHSKSVAELFNNAGIITEHMDATIKDSVRNAMIKRLEDGETKLITSVGVLSTGVDIPCLGAIIFARPTKSYNLYFQMVCRGTRIFPGKERFIVLDHAGVVSEHGFVTDERPCNLDGLPKGDRLTPIATCKECYFIYEPSKEEEEGCPNCGFVPEKIEGVARCAIVDASIELQEVKPIVFEGDPEIREFILDKAKTALTRGYNPNWVYHKMKGVYGSNKANQHYKFIRLEMNAIKTALKL